MYTYKVNLKRVVDADTIIFDIDLGFEVWLRNVTVRLNRIDAYETRLSKTTTPAMKALGLEGKVWLQALLDENLTDITIETNKRGKYGRWIAEVVVGGLNSSDALVSHGYAIYRDY